MATNTNINKNTNAHKNPNTRENPSTHENPNTRENLNARKSPNILENTNTHKNLNAQKNTNTREKPSIRDNLNAHKNSNMHKNLSAHNNAMQDNLANIVAIGEPHLMSAFKLLGATIFTPQNERELGTLLASLATSGCAIILIDEEYYRIADISPYLNTAYPIIIPINRPLKDSDFSLQRLQNLIKKCQFVNKGGDYHGNN